ncbi:MAG TPA: hypothetical protein VKV26_23555 [Dehalococcoidia bacterium]|nr:hypothetical protein [Dehalococcoidia bacterium]
MVTIFVIAIALVLLLAALPTLPAQMRNGSWLGGAIALLIAGAMAVYLVER